MSSKVINKKLLAPSKQSPDHVFLRKNPLVPEPSSGTNVGRETLYEPVLVCSPVLASQRIHQKDGKQTSHLITADDFDELSKQLDIMLLGGGASLKKEEVEVEEEKTVEEAEFLEHIKSVVTKSVSFDIKEKPAVGRFVDTVFSTKAKGEVTVKRCTRLAGTQGQM